MSTTLAQQLRNRTTPVSEKYSSFSETQRRQIARLPEGMQKRITVHPISECWNWRGAKNSSGYGCTTDGHGRSMLAHRKAYTILVGPIEGDLTIDHLCRNKLCMNAAHMEPVTREENSSRKLRYRPYNWVPREPSTKVLPSFRDIFDRYFGHIDLTAPQ